MKTYIKDLFTGHSLLSMRIRALPTLMASLGLILAHPVTAQSLTTLYSFPAAISAHSVILSGNTLYGTTTGGSGSFGTVFAINADGSGFTTLYSFTDRSDGAFPQAGLTLSGNILYGTASQGGSAAGTSGSGTVFAVNTDGTGFTIVYRFTARSGVANSDGASPWGGLVLSGDTLYGTAANGGRSGYGTVFAVNTDGAGFTTLHTFTAPISGINGDGILPRAGLVLSGDNLYGTAFEGGRSGYGTVFAVNTDGSGFTILHSFTGSSDGAMPWAGLTLSGNILYGTALDGGSSGNGTVFAVNTDGTGFTTLHSFTAKDGLFNTDGANPYGELTLSGNTLYGTADFGGSSGNGTVFAVNTDGTGFTVPYTFTGASDGGRPAAGVIFSSDTLYGTTALGGASGHGTVFILSLAAVAPNFSISASPSLQSVTSGSGTTYEATVTASGGFNGPVSFSASGLPSGATASFNPLSVNGSGSSAMTITTKSTTRTGSSSVRITNSPNGSPSRSTTVTLTIIK